MARNSLKNVLKAIDRVNKVVPVEQQFLDDLKRSIELDDMKNARKPSPSYSPSGMGCIRSMFYKRNGVDVPDYNAGYSMIGICESGTDRHERIQNAISRMKDNGFDCEYIDVAEYVKSRGLDHLEIVDKCCNETKLYDKERHISFLCDGIIKYQNKYYIVEFKTEASFKWQARKDVDPKHYNQAITYSLELRLDNVIFVYINRDIVDYKAYLFSVSESDRERIIDLINTCENYVINKKLPPLPEDACPKKCSYCSYKELCDRDSTGIVETVTTQEIVLISEESDDEK